MQGPARPPGSGSIRHVGAGRPQSSGSPKGGGASLSNALEEAPANGNHAGASAYGAGNGSPPPTPPTGRFAPTATSGGGAGARESSASLAGVTLGGRGTALLAPTEVAWGEVPGPARSGTFA